MIAVNLDGADSHKIIFRCRAFVTVMIMAMVTHDLAPQRLLAAAQSPLLASSYLSYQLRRAGASAMANALYVEQQRLKQRVRPGSVPASHIESGTRPAQQRGPKVSHNSAARSPGATLRRFPEISRPSSGAGLLRTPPPGSAVACRAW